MSLFIFFFFHRDKNKTLINLNWVSKESAIILNNWFMMYFLSVVLIGTVYPIFLDVISSEKISVGPPFYHKLIIPFLIPFLIAMAIGPHLKWIKSNLESKKILIFLLFISILISYLILKNFNQNFLINTILISSALYLFFVTIRIFFTKKFKNISQNITHLGFSLLILSILFNNLLSSEVITNLKIGESYENSKIKITLEDIKQIDEKNYNSVVANFKIISSDGKINKMSPELRIYNQPNIVTSEADIKTSLMKDKFIVINLVQNQEYFNVRYQDKPLMLWIWVSVLLLSMGGILSFFKKIPSIIIISFITVFLIFYKGLQETNIYTPNSEIKKDIPIFSSVNFDSKENVSSSEIFNSNKFYLLNIWASWCVPCRQEHAYLMRLSESDQVTLIGLNYKDNFNNAQNFLKKLGNPYETILLDEDGTISIEWGAYGVPETFLIHKNKIVAKYIGPLNEELINEIYSIIK